MTPNWDLFGPTLVTFGAAAAQIHTAMFERRTGQVVWWAKLPILPRSDYSDPAQFKRRQWFNIVGSIVWPSVAVLLAIKFLGL